MKIKAERGVTIAAAVLLSMAMPDLAFAQAAGGSFLSGLLQLIQGNVITTLGTLAIIGAGVVMLSMRMSIITIVAVCSGIWVIFNADTLIGMLRQ